jgi:hypothetical protein
MRHARLDLKCRGHTSSQRSRYRCVPFVGRALQDVVIALLGSFVSTHRGVIPVSRLNPPPPRFVGQARVRGLRIQYRAVQTSTYIYAAT